MNFYFLIAIAFGALSGFTEPPASPRTLAGVVHECGIRSACSAVRAHGPVLPHTRIRAAAIPVAFRTSPRVDAPLTGAATPRAPASRC
jgi:hypothetical protein